MAVEAIADVPRLRVRKGMTGSLVKRWGERVEVVFPQPEGSFLGPMYVVLEPGEYRETTK